MRFLQSMKESWTAYRQNQVEQIKTLKTTGGGPASAWRFFSLNLHLFMNMDAVRAAAREEAMIVGLRHDVPNGPDVPADLRDSEGRFFRTPSGFRISGRLLVQDMLEGSTSPGAPILLGLFPVVMMLDTLLAHMGSIGHLAMVLLNLGYLIMLWGVSGGWMTVLIALLMGAGGLLAFLVRMPVAGGVVNGMAGLLPNWLIALALGALPALLPWWSTRRERRNRARALAIQGTVANLESGGKLSSAHVAARQKQAEMAKTDTTAFIPYGVAEGVFTHKHDGYSPDAGMLLGQTVKDLSTHKITFGATGSGKSSCQATPDGIAFARSGYGGMMVLDGKGTGPADMALAMKTLGLPFTLIDPKNNPEIKVALLQGLTAEDAVLAVLSAFVSNGKRGQNATDESFFENSAATMLRHAAESLLAAIEVEKRLMARDEAAGQPARPREWRWTLKDWFRQVQDLMKPDFQTSFVEWMRANHPNANDDGLLADALMYIGTEVPVMDERTRSNIFATVSAWLAPAMSHPDLRAWATIEEGFDVRNVCRGALIGVRLPEFEFGKAGKLANALIKSLVFTEIRRRSTNWADDGQQKPVMMHVDECQDIVGPSDMAILPVARSQGLICNYLTQHIDGLFVKLGEHEANAFLGNFLSFVAYRSTPATAKWVIAQLGTTENLVFKASSLGIDYGFTARMALASPYRDPTHPLRNELRQDYTRTKAGRVRSVFRSIFQQATEDDAQRQSLLERATETHSVTSGTFELETLLSEAEWDAYTSTPFMAVAQVMRGGVRRRDVIQTYRADEWEKRKQATEANG